jgi:hypothetical protein
MRSLLLVLLLANLVLFAGQFDVIRDLVRSDKPPARPDQINAERLRIIRDTSGRPYNAAPRPATEGRPVEGQSASGTNN